MQRYNVEERRRVVLLLLLLACWGLSLLWSYVLDRRDFGWFPESVFALGLVLIPVVSAAMYSGSQIGQAWTFVHVAVLTFAAAPISNFVAVTLTALITREGP